MDHLEFIAIKLIMIMEKKQNAIIPHVTLILRKKKMQLNVKLFVINY